MHNKNTKMQKLGYIISNTRIRGIEDFIEVTSDPSYFTSNKPSLIVGLELARNNIKNFSILNKNPEKGKFWTFGKTEKRTDYEKDLTKFYNYILTNLNDTIKYYYVDISKLSKVKIKNLLSILNNDTKKYLYIYKEMLYLYYKDYVLGISLQMLKYMGFNVEKHLSKIRKNNVNKMFFNDKDVNSSFKQYAKNKKYLIPVFLSMLE